MTAHLICLETGEKHAILPAQPWLIGRDPNLAQRGLLISHPSISRIQASICIQQTQWMLQDEFSRNGTKVNGNRLDPLKPIALHHGDEISFSEEKYLFSLDAGQESSKEREKERISLARGISIENGGLRYHEDHPIHSFPVYQRKMLAEHRCSRLLPVTMMERENRIRIYHDIDGLCPLDRYLEKRNGEGGELLSILRQIAEGMKEAEHYLIRIEQIATDPDQIYIDLETRSVKLMVTPSDSDSKSFSQIYQALIHRLMTYPSEEGTIAMLERIAGQIGQEQLGLNSVIRVISSLEREQHLQKKGLGNWDPQPDFTTPRKEKALPESHLVIPWSNLMEWSKPGKRRLFLIQTGCVLLLALIFSLDLLRPTDFLGFSLLFLAADLWLMKSMNLI